LQPTSQYLSDAQVFKDKYRSDKVLANHLTGIAEGIPALGWVTVVRSPPNGIPSQTSFSPTSLL